MPNRYLMPVISNRACSRRHAIKIFAGCVGGTLLAGRLPSALADLPWGEEPVAIRLRPDSSPLALQPGQSYGKALRQLDPALALEPGGERLWTCWTQLHEEREAVLLRSFSIRDGEWGPVLAVSEAGSADTAAHEPELTFVGGRLLVVWSQLDAAGCTLHARTLDTPAGQLGPGHLLAGRPGEPESHAHPAIATTGQRAIVVWQAKLAGQKTHSVLARFVNQDGGPAGDVLEIATDAARDCCRPAVAAAPDGQHYAVVFERQDRPGTQNVYLSIVTAEAGRVDPPRAVSNHPASNLAPAVAHSPDGDWLYVAWHSNRRGEDGWDIPRWYRLAALRTRDDTWHKAEDPDPELLEQRDTVQGFELIRLVVSPRGVVCVLGRASHYFYVQYYTKDGRSPLYRLPEDGWGGRGRLLRGVFDANGSLWVTRRDLGFNVLHRIDGFGDLVGPPSLNPNPEPTRSDVRVLTGVTRRYEWPVPASAAAGLHVYFGDIHGHTWQSDGMGDPEESYRRARDVFHDDFHALTDHDSFVRKRLTDAQWLEQKAIVEHYHVPGEFVTLFGQEWTTARIDGAHGWGHFNVYTADRTIPLFDHTDARFRDLPELYTALRAHQALAIPHHIGWTGVRWDALDLQITPVVEICSVHGAYEYEGNEPIRHRGGIHGCFFRDGLAAGLQIGVVGGSDQHGLIWHHGVGWKRNEFRGGLTGIWAPELSREAVLDAIRARRTFAATGVKLYLYFAVNEQLMGATIESERPPSIQVDVAVPEQEGRLAWLDIVRDGTVINHYGGEGQRSRYTIVDEQAPSTGTACYYLRVTLRDGNMAWSSPVWVKRV